MEIWQLVALGLISAVLSLLLRQSKPEIAIFLALAAGLIIFYWLLDKVAGILGVLSSLAEEAGLNLLYLETILKIVGIAYLADFGSQICRDAGEGAVAAKIEFGAKILILVLAVPVLLAVLNTLLELIP
ncbi:MAG: stage III sporulation protein AD [Clostridia bacterium]|nr:stage III sporulation protein AD [Clostridia bacterium]